MSEESVKKPVEWMMFLGILVILSGILAIGSPFITGLSVTIFVGAMITVTGVSQLVHAFGLGILSVIAGLYLMIRPLQGLLGLTLIAGIFFIADGIGWIALAFSRRPEKGWGWHLFSGIISVLLGIMIFSHWPLSGVWAIGVLFGIRMLNAGFGMAFFGSAIRSLRKQN